MVQTAWNLGLFCFGSGRNDEGARLFDVINQVSTYGLKLLIGLIIYNIYDILQLAPFFQKTAVFTADQERVRAFVFTASFLFLYNQDVQVRNLIVI